MVIHSLYRHCLSLSLCLYLSLSLYIYIYIERYVCIGFPQGAARSPGLPEGGARRQLCTREGAVPCRGGCGGTAFFSAVSGKFVTKETSDSTTRALSPKRQNEHEVQQTCWPGAENAANGSRCAGQVQTIQETTPNLLARCRNCCK